MITKEAENKEKFQDGVTTLPDSSSVLFAHSARATFELLLKTIKPKKILMPAYIGETDSEGSGVFDPIRNTNTPYEFYEVNKTLEFDMTKLETKLKSGVFDALLVIHYYGFTQCNLEKVADLCKKYEVTFIEDCCHVWNSFFNRKRLGTFGDYALFSIHKIVATNTGGFLLSTTKEVPQNLGCDQQLKDDDKHIFMTTNWEKTDQIRKDNYQKYLSLLKDEARIRILFPNLPNDITPLNFAIEIKEGLREKTYFKMRDKGALMIALYYRLIEEIPKEEFPFSYELSKGILNLPVHQDITRNDVQTVVAALKKSLDELTN